MGETLAAAQRLRGSEALKDTFLSKWQRRLGVTVSAHLPAANRRKGFSSPQHSDSALPLRALFLSPPPAGISQRGSN